MYIAAILSHCTLVVFMHVTNGRNPIKSNETFTDNPQ
jgi:hypothetical protein